MSKLLEQRGASDGTRTEMVAGLGDEAGLLLRSAFGTPGGASGAIPTLDFTARFAAARATMEQARAGRVNERREKLVREIAEAAGEKDGRCLI